MNFENLRRAGVVVIAIVVIYALLALIAPGLNDEGCSTLATSNIGAMNKIPLQILLGCWIA